MAYGAPANAAGATAYSLELAAADGEATRNWGRGAGALAIFVIAALGGAFLRRRFA
jgi:putative membrane protein